MSGLAGRLRERVTISRRAAGDDAPGGAAGTWVPLATRQAAVEADGSGAAVRGEAVSAVPRFQMTLRAGVAVLPGDRIDWSGRVLAVRAVIADPAAPDRIMLRTEAVA